MTHADDGRRTEPWLAASEFERIYGPQQPWTPEQAREVLAGLEVPWWVAGGWALEAFSGVSRPHEDIDLSILRPDLPALRAHLEDDWHLWAASDQGLLHLAHDREMPDHFGQVWVREHALAPWRGEFLLNPDVDGAWQCKRDPTIVLALDEATWTRDGIRYLRPELVLVHKVATGRPKDDDDLAATLPLLDDAARGLLARFLAIRAPEHPSRALVDAD